MKPIIHSPNLDQSKKILDYAADKKTDIENAIVDMKAEKPQLDTNDKVMPTAKSSAVLELEAEKQALLDELTVTKEKYAEIIENFDDLREAIKKEALESARESIIEEIEQAVVQRVEQGEKIIQELNKKLVSDIYDQEEVCLEIIYSVVCRIVGESVGTKQQIKGILRQVIDDVTDLDNITINVSPHDYALLSDDESVKNQLIVSDDLQYGGCLIKTGKGSLEAKLDQQLSTLKNILLKVHGAEH